MKITFHEWKATRHNLKKKNVIVVSRSMFPAVVDLLSDCDDVAYISIECTEDCAKYNRFSDNTHLLDDADNVCNVDFDDINEDTCEHGYCFKTITQEQADKIVDFIENNKGKDFIVHCRAGKSRSQGIFAFMMEMYPDEYEETPLNKMNPCLTPNREVVRKLKRAFYKKYNIFEIEED